MDRDAFWKLVKASSDRAHRDPDEQIEILTDEVRKLPVEEVIAFGDHFHALWHDAYRWDIWGAAYLIGGGCSDDGFMDFRGWLIAQGREVYEATLADPESLGEILDEDNDGKIEGFQYIASQVWGEKTGLDASDFPSYEGPTRREPAGKKWTDDDLPRLFPNLWKKFGD